MIKRHYGARAYSNCTVYFLLICAILSLGEGETEVEKLWLKTNTQVQCKVRQKNMKVKRNIFSWWCLYFYLVLASWKQKVNWLLWLIQFDAAIALHQLQSIRETVTKNLFLQSSFNASYEVTLNVMKFKHEIWCLCDSINGVPDVLYDNMCLMTGWEMSKLIFISLCIIHIPCFHT